MTVQGDASGLRAFLIMRIMALPSQTKQSAKHI